MNMKKKKRVIVGMSGGVDSSVAATLLKDQNYDVVGISMSIWDNLSSFKIQSKNACFGPDECKDISEARRVADMLGIPFHVFSLKKEFNNIVLKDFRNEYCRGNTPNPCIICNSKIKFGILLEKAMESQIEFDFFATGHYVQLEYNTTVQRFILKRAVDLQKDQSYFLYSLSQDQLKCCLFPLGKYTKHEVKQIAKEKGLGIETKKESQDFFSGDYTDLIDSPHKPGKIINRRGDILGEHKGLIHYTIGQRRGLGIAAEEPLYVIDKDIDRNIIIAGTKSELYNNGLIAYKLNWLLFNELSNPMEVSAKIRYRSKEAAAVISPGGQNTVICRFKESQSAITPGQSVVFYKEGIVVGGGIIMKTIIS